ncbi:hypothetical protein C8J28_115114 [Cereibacter azotoformans]|uniref:Uncharacterized protein n=1 Tax=Cereibacter azotoformans TaxID=43057 RepID=A0A2T5JXS8_9RHOB|nr:hypothetical protein C8J28_115114 [Cereibacter azotoformans]
MLRWIDLFLIQTGFAIHAARLSDRTTRGMWP